MAYGKSVETEPVDCKFRFPTKYNKIIIFFFKLALKIESLTFFYGKEYFCSNVSVKTEKQHKNTNVWFLDIILNYGPFILVGPEDVAPPIIRFCRLLKNNF